MQEYGRANIIPMLLELDEIERFHPLQLWINYMNEVPSKRSGKPLDPGDFQRLLCFKDGLAVKPPPIPFEFSDNHEGWKYWLDHIRNY